MLQKHNRDIFNDVIIRFEQKFREDKVRGSIQQIMKCLKNTICDILIEKANMQKEIALNYKNVTVRSQGVHSSASEPDAVRHTNS